jgi:hypothetical protein
MSDIGTEFCPEDANWVPACIEDAPGLVAVDSAGVAVAWADETGPLAAEPAVWHFGACLPEGVDVIQVDTEVICNEATGLLEYHQVTTTNGVPAAPVVTVSTIACVPEAAPEVEVDVEYVCNVDTGFYDEVTTTIVDGLIDSQVTVATSIACLAPVVEVDVEYVCNEATGFYDEVTTTTTDGVAAQSTVATTLPCSDGAPEVEVDVEYVCNLDTGVYDEVTTTIVDGAVDSQVTAATAIACVADVVEVDVEYVCNEATGFYDVVTTTTTDGVAAAPVIEATTIVCNTPVLDIETERVCNADGFIHIVTTATNPVTLVTTEVSDVITNERCDECPTPFTPECLVKRTVTVGYDNGVTPGSSSNNCGARPNFIRFSWPFEVVSWVANGQTVGAGDALGPFTGWTPQLQGWADFFNNNNTNTPGSAFAEFGFLPAPTWRFAEITDCDPRALYGPLKIKRTDTGCIYTVFPAITSETFETAYRYATLDCDGNKTIVWCDADGNTVEAPENPECYVPCGFDFGDFIVGESECVTADPVFACNSVDGDLTNVVVIVTDCPDGRTTEVYTEESYLTAASPDDLVEVDIVQLVDCESGEPIDLDPKCTIEDALVVCPAVCETALQITTGRPLNTVPWTLETADGVLVSGATFQEFGDNLAAAGYNQFIVGETHYICPCPAEAVDQPAGTVFVTADGNTVVKPACAPNPDPNFEADSSCALQTTGKNDDRLQAQLDTLIEAQNTTNDLLAQLIECLCGPCDDEPCEPTCAWGAGNVDGDNVWQPSEGGMTWNLCGETYVVPAGEYTNEEMAAWVAANTPHTMTVIPDPARAGEVIIYFSLPCDCEAPSFQFGDDDPVTLAALPAFNDDCESGGGDDDGLGPDEGDQTICQTEKLGADISSTATGNAVHAVDSLFNGTGPVAFANGSFTITDSASATHVLTNGGTITGLASGATTQVTFTGQIEFTRDGTLYRCNVTDKPISANFTVV